jgi:hypothetical protein
MCIQQAAERKQDEAKEKKKLLTAQMQKLQN